MLTETPVWSKISSQDRIMIRQCKEGFGFRYTIPSPVPQNLVSDEIGLTRDGYQVSISSMVVDTYSCDLDDKVFPQFFIATINDQKISSIGLLTNNGDHYLYCFDLNGRPSAYVFENGETLELNGTLPECTDWPRDRGVVLSEEMGNKLDLFVLERPTLCASLARCRSFLERPGSEWGAATNKGRERKIRT